MNNNNIQIIQGDCIEGMKTLPDQCVHTVITSPPYYGLRDYGVEGQIGLEETPEAYVQRLVDVFREVRRILRDDGTVWLNLGDSYASSGISQPQRDVSGSFTGRDKGTRGTQGYSNASGAGVKRYIPNNLKPKDLIGIPWRVAFALQADGWWLRQDIIWHKPNPMPESVTDRCTKAHEYIFLLTKSERYYYDAEAVKEESKYTWNSAKSFSTGGLRANKGLTSAGGRQWNGTKTHEDVDKRGRNKRSVWTVNTRPYKDAHFAVFPPKLIEPCVLAGTSEKGCCATCGSPWKRLNGRLCKNCGNFIEHQHKFCNACEFVNSEWKNERVVNLATRAGESNVIGALVARKLQITVNHISLDFIKSCDCDSGIVPCTVFDPFTGSGTTALVALQYGRKFIGTELNPEYVELAQKRLSVVQTQF